MTHSIIKTALIATALLLSAGLSLAVENKPGTPPEAKAVNSSKTTAKSAKTEAAKAPAKAKIVNINSAGKKELKTLPGIGDAEADKIIAGRPYFVKTDLVTNNILPRATYENLKALVSAKSKQNLVPIPGRK
jgi:DNA uptake protein ComE-like DNA-binding protein